MQEPIINPKLVEAKSGAWAVSYTTLINGRSNTRTISTGTSEIAAAEAFFETWKAHNRNLIASFASPELGSLLRAYQSVLTSRRAGETNHICIAHLIKGLGKVRLRDLTAARLLEYRNSRGVSDPTLRRELGVLKSAIKQGYKDGVINLDAIPHIELPRPSQAKLRYLPEAEEEVFYDLAINTLDNGRLSRIARFIAIGLDTGARKNDIVRLVWGQIDFENAMVDFRIEGEALSNKRKGCVPINRRLMPVLRRAYDERTSDFVLDHPGSIRKQWETFVARHNYKLTPHDMRRTLASIAVSNGASFEDVAEVLSDSVAIVRKHYGHLDPRAKKRVTDMRWL